MSPFPSVSISTSPSVFVEVILFDDVEEILRDPTERSPVTVTAEARVVMPPEPGVTVMLCPPAEVRVVSPLMAPAVAIPLDESAGPLERLRAVSPAIPDEESVGPLAIDTEDTEDMALPMNTTPSTSTWPAVLVIITSPLVLLTVK